MIKYHDNKNGVQYGPDGMLTNNWNPEAKYGKNDYVNVYFRIECSAFDCMYGSFKTEEGRAEFEKEKQKVFESIGWKVDKPDNRGYCMEVSKGKQNLYLHPQNFSGEVLKREVKQIAEALADNKTFTVRWVDLYDTVYDVTDEEYEEMLKLQRDKTRELIFKNCATTRRNKFFYKDGVAYDIGKVIMLPRIGCTSCYQPTKRDMDFVSRVINEMVTEGYLVCANEKTVRSLNKTELKKAKLKELVV